MLLLSEAHVGGGPSLDPLFNDFTPNLLINLIMDRERKTEKDEERERDTEKEKEMERTRKREIERKRKR